MTKMSNLPLVSAIFALNSSINSSQPPLDVEDLKLQCLGKGELIYHWPWNGEAVCSLPLENCPDATDNRWLVQTSKGDELECVERKCEPPDVFRNGSCSRPWESICKKQGKGLVPITDFQGNLKCICRSGWVQGSDGKCHLQYTRGNCPAGQIILTRSEAMQVRGSDVPCADGSSCVNKCGKPLAKFNRQMVNLYDHHTHRCSRKGRPGVCCPTNILRASESDLVKYFADRISSINKELGVCIPNPCKRGQSLYFQESRGDKKLICVKADTDVATCRGFLYYTESEGLDCCSRANICLTPLSAFSPSRQAKCKRGFFFSSRRSRCSRVYG